MLPLAHIYLATKAAEKKDLLLSYGSVLPDFGLLTANPAFIKIHGQTADFHEYIKSNYPEYYNLSFGSLMHCVESKGADFYSDDHDNGFAYIYGKQIQQEVSDLLQLEPSYKTLVYSHNIIEGALDSFVSKDFPFTLEFYKDAQSSLDFALIAEVVSSFIEADKEEVKEVLQKFNYMLAADKFYSKEKLFIEIGVPILVKISGKNFDINEGVKVFERACKLIEPYYKDFLENTCVEMKETFRHY